MKVFSDTYVKNIGLLFSGNIIAQLIPFVLAPIITRIFSPEDIGVHGNFIALVTLISIIANGRLELAIVLPQSNKIAIQLIKLGLKISICISLISFSILFIKSPLEAFYKTNLLSQFLPLISITVLTISTHNLFIQWLVRNKLFKSISLIKIALSLITNLSFITLGWLGYGVSGLIYGYIIGFGITTIILLFLSKNTLSWNSRKVKSDLELIKEYKEFPLINSLHAFSDILFQDFIILAMITSYYGIATTGLYVIMMKYLKAPTRFIGSAIGQVFYPEANRNRIEQKPTKHLLIKSIQITLVAAIPVTAIILIFGPKLFGWYLGSEWVEVGYFSRIMILPIILGLISSPISSTPIIYNQQKTSFIINLCGMITALIVFYIISLYTLNIYYAMFGLAAIQSLLYIIILGWYFKLSKV